MTRIGDQGPKLPQHHSVEGGKKQSKKPAEHINNQTLLNALDKMTHKQMVKVLKELTGIKNLGKLLEKYTTHQILDVFDGVTQDPKLESLLHDLNEIPYEKVDAIVAPYIQKGANSKDAPPATWPNPPPQSLKSSNPQLWQQLDNIYKFLNQTLSGNQWWYEIEGSIPLDSLSMDTLNKMMDFLKNGGADMSSATVSEMQNLIKQYGPEVEKLAAFATKTYTVQVDGKSYQFTPGSMIFNWENPNSHIPGSDCSNVIDLYNEACAGTDGAATALENWQQAYEAVQSNSSYIADMADAKKNGQIVVNALFAPSSTFYLDFLNEVIMTPTIDPTKIDPSWISFVDATVGANYIMGTLKNDIANNTPEWISYLESQGMSPADASTMATKITTVLSNQLLSTFNEFHTNPPPKLSPLQVIQKLQALSPCAQPFSAYSSDQKQQIYNMMNMLAPLLSDQSTLNSLISSLHDKLSRHREQIAICYWYLKTYTKGAGPKMEKLLPQMAAAISSLSGIQGSIQKQDDAISALLGNGINGILVQKTGIPSNFQQEISQMEGDVKNLMNDSSLKTAENVDTAAISLINGTPGNTLVNQVVSDDKDLKKFLIGPNKDNLTPPAGMGTSIWFDTSYVSSSDPLDSFKQYLENAMVSGVTELKLSFSTFTDEGNTLEQFLKETKMTVSQLSALAETYGISISTSCGGEVGNSLKFPAGETPAQYAQTFYDEYCKGAKSIDFDLEDKGLMIMESNGTQAMQEFFSTLHGLLAKNGQQLQLTVAGDQTAMKPIEFLFQDKLVDRVNLMLYGDGSSYWISKNTKGAQPGTTPSWSLNNWVDMLVKDMGLSPAQAIGMLGIDFQDQTPYNSDDPSVINPQGGDPYPEQMLQEIAKAAGKPVTDMTRGEAAYWIQKTVLNDLCADYNIKPGGAHFAPCSWWVDENRVGDKGSGDLHLYPEEDMLTQRILDDLSNK